MFYVIEIIETPTNWFIYHFTDKTCYSFCYRCNDEASILQTRATRQGSSDGTDPDHLSTRPQTILGKCNCFSSTACLRWNCLKACQENQSCLAKGFCCCASNPASMSCCCFRTRQKDRSGKDGSQDQGLDHKFVLGT